MKGKSLILQDNIEGRILIIRGQRVIVDRDLAELYCVETKYLNRQVRRNKGRFPPEFVFFLTRAEKEELVTNWHRFRTLKHSSVPPCVFTEHGTVMAANVVNSPKAVQASVYVVKAFIRLRDFLNEHKELAKKLAELEAKLTGHDETIRNIVAAIKGLVSPPEKPKPAIGFRPETK